MRSYPQLLISACTLTMKKLKDIKAERGTIRAQVLEDADGEVSYIKDAAEHGCIGGGCRGLIMYVDTHAFYNTHAQEIFNLLEEMEYNILEGMKRLNQIDICNFLAWLAYEVRAQEIMSELEDEHE